MNYYLHIIRRNIKFYTWLCKENISKFFGLQGYDGYFSKKSRTLRKAEKMGKTVNLFTGEIQ